ncbi:hypothetical protein D3C76_1474100 [compost metagenome]
MLILVDQTSDQFDQPGVFDLAHGADPELLDQYHFIALGIVRQHAHRIVTHEQLAADLAAHASGKQLVAQTHLVEPVKALVAIDLIDDLDLAGRCVVERV